MARRRGIRSVQSVVRNGPLFFEAPAVALFEYDRDDLLGMMEVSYAPDMFIRSDHYGADEFFEMQGTRGFMWVTRLCGNLHVDLPPVVLYEEDGRRSTFSRSSTRRTTGRSAGPRAHSSTGSWPERRPISIPARPFRRCSCVSPCTRRRTSDGPVDPATIDGSVSPNGWPPTEAKMRVDVEELFRREARPSRDGFRARADEP